MFVICCWKYKFIAQKYYIWIQLILYYFILKYIMLHCLIILNII